MPPRAGYGAGGAVAPPRYCQVLVFGDSWAAYQWPCWPERVAEKLRLPCFNLAVPGSTTAQLPGQVSRVDQRAGLLKGPDGELREGTLCIIHTGGNDFIQRFGLDMLQRNPGRAEALLVRQCLEALQKRGAKHFLVSDVPLSSTIPLLRMIGLPLVMGGVNQGIFREMGIEPGDPPELVLEVQSTALHDAWEETIHAFQRSHPEVKVTHFNEPCALTKITQQAGGSAQLWDMSQFHPTDWGHRRLAEEAHSCLMPRPAAAPTAAPTAAPPRPAAAKSAAPAPAAQAAAAAPAAAPAADPLPTMSLAELEIEKRKAFEAKDFARCKVIHARMQELQK